MGALSVGPLIVAQRENQGQSSKGSTSRVSGGHRRDRCDVPHGVGGHSKTRGFGYWTMAYSKAGGRQARAREQGAQ